MASKKYLFLAVSFCLLASYGFSQRVGTSYDVKDSSLVPGKRMPQHTEFLNGQYNFPSKPRNQWEIGVKGGLFQVSGDIPAQFVSPGFGAHVRKAFGYIFSLRLSICMVSVKATVSGKLRTMLKTRPGVQTLLIPTNVILLPKQ
jgi:hypothetical protein